MSDVDPGDVFSAEDVGKEACVAFTFWTPDGEAVHLLTLNAHQAAAVSEAVDRLHVLLRTHYRILPWTRAETFDASSVEADPASAQRHGA